MGIRRSLLGLIAIATLFAAGCATDMKPENGGSGQADHDSDADCRAENAWITQPSQPDGKSFQAKSNCSFHRWSYQTFLWLVSNDSGGLVFEGFANPNALFKPEGPGSYPGHGGDRTMLARMAKSRTTADIEDIYQAGPGNKALIDQAGNIVYYANHLNREYWDFVARERLYDVEVLKRTDPSLNFPIDTLELKSAWRIAQIVGREPFIPDSEKRYYVVSAKVPSVKPNARGILIEDKSRMIDARMALIGLHVTGIVKGHREFIWATFEHVDNAPDCADIPPAASAHSTWNLYNGRATRATANQFDVGDPLAVVNVCRTHPDGGGSDANRSAIQTLNASVQALLGDTLWSNYRLGGAVWTSGQVPVNNGAFTPADIDAGGDKPPTQLGSLDLANTTMETFTQDQNCFACHNGGAHEIVVMGTGPDTPARATEVNAKNINLSHFVVNYQASRQVANDRNR